MGCAQSPPQPGPQPVQQHQAPVIPPQLPVGMATLLVQVPPGAGPGALLQLRTPHGSTIQCQVPPGIGPRGQFQAQYPIPKQGPNLVDESARLENNKAVSVTVLPKYWTNVKIPGNTAFDQMIYIDRAQHATFQELFTETYFAKATRDRKCPKNVKCPLTAGGCPCVQVDGDPGLPKDYRVRRVIRVEDSEMWGRYVENRESRLAARQREISSGEMPHLDPPAKTDVVADRHGDVFEQLEESINEVYLWHGTSVRRALAIAQEDFKVDMAGNNVGTMYGQGCYLAESCTKADEYASDEPKGCYYEGVFALLLCRVCLGKYYYTLDRDENAGKHVESGRFDSTVGDRSKAAGTFREFVVYNADAIYPEYVVLYNRVYKKDRDSTISLLASNLFHMQVPVYWRNCHKNPNEEFFHEQYIVRPHVKVLLQRLVEACFKDKGKVILKEARRIENSTIWCKYVAFKQQLQGALPGRAAKFMPPHELDGDSTSGHTLTHVHLEGENVEESISISNLDERLNEILLWHGTSKEAAEKIVQNDFNIPKGKDMKHAARFGNGAYLAEDLEKSLVYADSTDDGTKVVLLCRVLCGDFYYTEQHTEIDANQRREQGKKHSVLANPEKKGPREFIVPDSSQVYPEFMLELAVPDWVQPEPQRMAQTTLEVTVPPNVGPGMRIRVQVPDGREVEVIIPQGAYPGMKIQMPV